MARNCYHDNIRTNVVIDELDKSYRSADVFSWCFRSPFPSRFLNHALYSRNKEQLNVCRFLLTDATRFFEKQSNRKFCAQVYRGMKLSNELVDRFETQVGKLVCTTAFFPCMKSRTNALAIASLSTYRPDLLPVLFKIECESTDLISEISNQLSSSSVVFDVSMAFRVLCINRGQMTIIKLKTAGKDGKQIAQDYLNKHNDKTMESLLDQLLTPTESLTSSLTRRISTVITADEWEARKHVDQGEIDLALIAYKRIHPVSPRILNAIGQLCTDKKGDYNYAFECHSKALKMQEQVEFLI